MLNCLKEVLKNIGEVLGAVDDRPTRTMRFSPVDDAENTQLWNRLTNVRYKRDGIREDIVVRGGTTEYSITGSINGNIVTTKGFEAAFGSTVKDYLFIHTDTGYVYTYNSNDDILDDFGDSHGFNTQTPLTVINNGRFVYLFDYVTQTAKYIDLKEGNIYRWLSYNPPSNNRLAFVSGFDTVTSGNIEQKNIWGFEEGVSVIVYPLSEPFADATNDRPGVYSYVFNDGQYLEIDGEPVKYDTVLVLAGGRPDTFVGSGTEPTLELLFAVPVIDGEYSFDPITASIQKISANVSGDQFVHIENVWEYYFGEPDSFPVTIDRFLLLPNTPDIQDSTGEAPKYIVDENNKSAFILNDLWEAPTLYRSYCYVYEFDDGSFSVPSQHKIVQVSSDTIFDINGDMQIYGVKLFMPPSPANVVQVHLFSTRWQTDMKRALVPGDKYPNGPFFFAGSHQPKDSIFTIEDYTPDRNLVQPLAGYTTLSGGVSTLFGSGQLAPRHVASHKAGILIGGYTIQRPSVTIASDFDEYEPKIFVNDQNADAAVADVYLQAAYEYPSGSLGEWITCNALIGDWAYRPQSEVNIFPESALVSGVHFYIRDERGASTEYRFVKRVGSTDPEYFGVPFTIGDIAEYTVDSLPPGSAANETLDLPGYFVFGTPPQQVEIGSQKPVEYGNYIEALEMLAVDDDRADRVRYQLAIFTNEYPLIGYFDISENSGDLLFQIDMERVGTPTGFVSKESIFKQQRSILYQGYEGIFVLSTGGVQLLIPKDDYPQLSGAILSTGFHFDENEVWFLLPDNECIAIDFDDNDAPRILQMAYPSTSARAISQLTDLGVLFIASAEDHLLLLDQPAFTDAGIKTDATAPAVTGILDSDYLTGMQQQIYLDVIELLGSGYSARCIVDLQDSRFDDSVDEWTDAFTESINTGLYGLTMRGVVLALESRGVAPRLRIVIEPVEDGRFAGAELHYTPLEHEGAARY